MIKRYYLFNKYVYICAYMTSICFLGEQYLMIYRPASEMDASDQCVQCSPPRHTHTHTHTALSDTHMMR